MNKWAMRALGGAACTAGILAFGLGVASADEPGDPGPDVGVTVETSIGDLGIKAATR